MHKSSVTITLLLVVLPGGGRMFGQVQDMGILNDDYVCTINGQVFRGTSCYPAPMRDGKLALPLGGPDKIYFIVDDADQEFIYDLREAKEHASEHARLFGSEGWNVEAHLTPVRLDEHRWRVSGSLPDRQWQLIFGKIVKGGIWGRLERDPTLESPWILNMSDVTLPQQIQEADPRTKDYRFKGGMERVVAEYSQRVAANPSDIKLRLKRAFVYATLGQFQNAYLDYEKAGGALVVKVELPEDVRPRVITPSMDAPLMAGSERVGGIPFSTQVTVKRVEGEWLWIDQNVKSDAVGGASRKVSGWLHQKYARHVK